MSFKNKTKKAILLSAGYGKRLGALTSILPKCLMPICGRPLLDYWIESLISAGIEDILINLHYKHEIVTAWIKDSPYKDIIRTSYEEKLLGTGGTLLKNSFFSNGYPVMVIHADNLCSANLNDFIRTHEQRPDHTDMTMMTFITDTPQSCGIVKLDNNGIVKEYYEKVDTPPGNLANAAIYIVEPSIFEFLKNFGKEIIDFSTEIIPAFMGRIYTYHNNKYHRDIGSTISLLKAQFEFPFNENRYFTTNSWAFMSIIDSDFSRKFINSFHDEARKIHLSLNKIKYRQ